MSGQSGYDALISRLYAVLDVDLTRARGLEPLVLFATWLEAGVRLVQLRAKTLAGGTLLDLADQMAGAARAARATLIVNDRADVARMSGADGVHLGQDDLHPDHARTILGPSSIVGVSTHNERQIRAAADELVNYLAIGPVFATTTKTRPYPVVGLDGVRLAVQLAHVRRLPVVAIGGITLETAPDVIGAGADAVAVISDLLTDDPGRRCRQYVKALD